MEATFETFAPDEPTDGYHLERLGDGQRTTLVLRPTATGNAERYEVESDIAGPDAGRPAGAVTVVYFDGPLSPARLAAARYGYQTRIAPALATVPGHIRTLVLWQPVTAAVCVVGVAVDLAALDVIGRAVNSTELLPGEDAALLTGPDRVEVHRVVTPASSADTATSTQGAHA